MKIYIEGEEMTKEDLMKIGEFLTGFFVGRKDLIKVLILEGTEDMSKEECAKFIGKMFKEKPHFTAIMELEKDGTKRS